MSQTVHWIYAKRAVLPTPNGGYTICPALLCLSSILQNVITQPDEVKKQLKQIPPESLTTYSERYVITPSFINAHTHLAMVCFRALGVEAATGHNVVEDLFFKVESALEPEDIAAFAQMGAYESLLCGVGLVWDHYYQGRALAEAIAQTPLCAVIAPTLQDLSGPGKQQVERQWEETLSLIEDPLPGIWAAFGPHATDTVSPELWGRITQEATTRNVPIHVHVAQSVDEWHRAHTRHDTTPVGMLDKLGVLDAPVPVALVHAIYMSQKDFQTLDPSRHFLGFCPYSQLIFEFPADVQAWHEHGLPWFAATDCAASNDSMNVQKELRYIGGMRTNPTSSSTAYANFERDPSPQTAQTLQSTRVDHPAARAAWTNEDSLLQRVWDIPGRMHPAFRAGQIAPGALANLTIWDMHHPSLWPGTHPLRTLGLGDTCAAIHQMVSLGAWVGEEGDFHRSLTQSPEYIQARQRADSSLKALRARLSL